MEYKNVKIRLLEVMPDNGLPLGAMTYQDTVGGLRSKGVTYVAASLKGTAFAKTPQQALDDCKSLIDAAL